MRKGTLHGYHGCIPLFGSICVYETLPSCFVTSTLGQASCPTPYINDSGGDSPPPPGDYIKRNNLTRNELPILFCYLLSRRRKPRCNCFCFRGFFSPPVQLRKMLLLGSCAGCLIFALPHCRWRNWPVGCGWWPKHGTMKHAIYCHPSWGMWKLHRIWWNELRFHLYPFALKYQNSEFLESEISKPARANY